MIFGKPGTVAEGRHLKYRSDKQIEGSVERFPEEQTDLEERQIMQGFTRIDQVNKSPAYTFHNPAGCAPVLPADLSPATLLKNVQAQIGDSLDLKKRSINTAWNGPSHSYMDISGTPYVYEFVINEFQPPFTYLADRLVTSFVQNGFAVWLRSYGGAFRLLAVSMTEGLENSPWKEYAEKYWQKGGLPQDDWIIPVSRKLPCQWMVDQAYVTNERISEVINLDWTQPDYLSAGREYLASNCSEAYRISQEEIGYWDATSMCGPLTWQILHDADSFPYRIGSYDDNSNLFIQANPKYWGNRPWIGFDPESYDLIRIEESLAGFDFREIGDLQSGDIVFSFGSPDQWSLGGGFFSHIFMVAGLDWKGSRLAVTNMVKNYRGERDCFISEVVLYTPGVPGSGVINYEWNDHGYGTTGRYGFDVFRWKWISYHLEGKAREYTVRLGDTVETIAFDWKVSPEQILGANYFINGAYLEPGQVIILPVPDHEEVGEPWPRFSSP